MGTEYRVLLSIFCAFKNCKDVQKPVDATIPVPAIPKNNCTYTRIYIYIYVCELKLKDLNIVQTHHSDFGRDRSTDLGICQSFFS